MFELSAGQIVADKYRIDGIMGTGGMGVVVAATHVELDQRVAIKFLREISPEALARFQREARLLVRLKSPHVARVHDVGSLDDDTPYIVMEHLDGEDLATVVTAKKRLPVEETVDYILQAAEAVAEAHALGMVHRDLKPANLFLARGPGGTTTVKVLDFGVSKILDDRIVTGDERPRGGDLTNEGVALGSPGYMSPEQMTSSRDVDARSDIFSLGALLYRLVGGQTPYKGTAVVSILATMATEGLTPLRTLAPEVSPAFAGIVERCLAQDKALRFPTVAHLAHALAPFANRRGRVIIEQILATMNVTFPDDASFNDTTEGQTLGATVVRPVLPPAPAMGPPPMGGLGSAMQTGPQFAPTPGWAPHPTISPPVASERLRPTASTPSKNAQVGPLVVVGVGLVLVAGLVAWRVVRAAHRQAAEDGDTSSVASAAASASTLTSTTSLASASPGATTPPSLVTTEPVTTTTVPPTTEAPPSTVSTGKPRGPATSTRGRPPPHGATPPPHGTSTTAPMPTDVPGGRH